MKKMLIRNYVVLLICLATAVRLVGSASYLSELLVNRTVERMREFDLNGRLENYIAEQDVYMFYLNELKFRLEEEEHLTANTLDQRTHPAVALKVIRQRVFLNNVLKQADIDVPMQSFDSVAVQELLNMVSRKEELSHLARGIIRLMEYYTLKFEDIIQGYIGQYKAKPLTYDEIIDLALTSRDAFLEELEHERNDCTLSVESMPVMRSILSVGMKTAIRRRDVPAADKMKRAHFDIMDASYNHGNCSCSSQMVSIIDNYKSVIDEHELVERTEACNGVEPLTCNKTLRNLIMAEKNTRQICRHVRRKILNGHSMGYTFYTDVEETTDLNCYMKYDHPSLLYKGGKVEDLYDGKYKVQLAYDVVTDNEIRYLKEIATTRMKRATVMHPNHTQPRESSKRTSRAYIVNDDHVLHLSALRARLEGLFGFKVNNDSAENIKIGHYGPTGGFDPHVDTQSELGENDRLATILVYLDEASTGETIFDKIGGGLSVIPVKGSAVMFPLYFKNGTALKAARHASCPLPHGEKWIITQWVRKFGNEFTYPCSLNWDD